jgi:hypothetical protein
MDRTKNGAVCGKLEPLSCSIVRPVSAGGVGGGVTGCACWRIVPASGEVCGPVGGGAANASGDATASSNPMS